MKAGTGHRSWVPAWTDAERKLWIAGYRAKLSVLLPYDEHPPGECDHCDALRELMREADED
jgi:hypothetical protein